MFIELLWLIRVSMGVYKHMQTKHAVELETWQCDIEHIYLGIPPPASECLEVLD
jgi:hypothetical protein